MILVDTSVWIEWLRATGSAADKAVQELRGEPQRLATTAPVRMEVLAGVSPRGLGMVSDVLDSAVPLPVDSYTDFDTAAELFRAARATGRTVRSLLDCVIAAVAIREHAALLHRDHDFAVLSDIAPDLVCHSTLE